MCSVENLPQDQVAVALGIVLWDATSRDYSPDRLDALVWAVTELAVDAAPLRLVNAEPPVGDPHAALRRALNRLRRPPTGASPSPEST